MCSKIDKLSKPNWTSTSIQQEFELDYILTGRLSSTICTSQEPPGTHHVVVVVNLPSQAASECGQLYTTVWIHSHQTWPVKGLGPRVSHRKWECLWRQQWRHHGRTASTHSSKTYSRPGPPSGLSLRGELLLEAVLPSDWLHDTILVLLKAKPRKLKWLRHRLRLLVKIFQLSFTHCINNLGYSV